MPHCMVSLLPSRSSRQISVTVTLVLCAIGHLAAQAGKSPSLIWVKFSKDFISRHYAPDSALGELVTTDPKPAKTVHPSTCGGHDGEIHIGIFPDSLTGNQKGSPNSSLPPMTRNSASWPNPST